MEYGDIAQARETREAFGEPSVGTVEAYDNQSFLRGDLAGEAVNGFGREKSFGLVALDFALRRAEVGTARKRVVELNVDMDRSGGTAEGSRQRVVDEAVEIPGLDAAAALGRKVIRALDDVGEELGLADGLAIVLVDLLGRPVGGNRNQRHAAIKGLGEGRTVVERCRTRGAYHCDGTAGLDGNAEGDEGRRTLVDDNAGAQRARAVDRDNQRRIARARRQHDILDAILRQEINYSLTRQFIG